MSIQSRLCRSTSNHNSPITPSSIVSEDAVEMSLQSENPDGVPLEDPNSIPPLPELRVPNLLKVFSERPDAPLEDPSRYDWKAIDRLALLGKPVVALATAAFVFNIEPALNANVMKVSALPAGDSIDDLTVAK